MLYFCICFICCELEIWTFLVKSLAVKTICIQKSTTFSRYCMEKLCNILQLSLNSGVLLGWRSLSLPSVSKGCQTAISSEMRHLPMAERFGYVRKFLTRGARYMALCIIFVLFSVLEVASRFGVCWLELLLYTMVKYLSFIIPWFNISYNLFFLLFHLFMCYLSSTRETCLPLEEGLDC